MPQACGHHLFGPGSLAAAIGTETEMSYEIIGGTYDRLPNKVLSKALHENLQHVGGVHYDEEEMAFARELSQTLPSPKPLQSASEVQPMVFTHGKASADPTSSTRRSWATANRPSTTGSDPPATAVKRVATNPEQADQRVP